MEKTDELQDSVYKRLPDAELEIMRIIWAASGPMTSADVMEQIRPRGRWATTTVLNFLGRLVEKGFVRTRKQGKCNIYSAVADETAYLQQEGRALLERLFDGSVVKMVSMLFSAGTLDEDDLAELGEFIRSTGEKEETPQQETAGETNRWASWYKRHFRFE